MFKLSIHAENVDQIIRNLKLKPHPEGGFFRETYRSEGIVTNHNLGIGYSGSRNYSTCIYFLLTSDIFSAFHRIKQDEIWHYYDGSSIFLHVISPNGEYTKTIIGRDFELGEVPQFVVAGGSWFAANVVNENSYSLLGCTVSPGFDFSDFELAIKSELTRQYPLHKDIIADFTR